jgi:hypothetical protein
VDRVRRWRAEHAGYSRGRRRRKPPEALQDLAPTQATQDEVVAKVAEAAPSDFVQREPALSSCSAMALQDLASVQTPLLAGLISTMIGDALQEEFAVFTRSLVERGRRVLVHHALGGLGSAHAS